MTPISLLLEEIDGYHIEVLDVWYSAKTGLYTWVVHDHSRSWGEVEIYEFYYAPTDQLRHMWE